MYLFIKTLIFHVPFVNLLDAVWNTAISSTGRVWCELLRDFLSNPNSAINTKNILTKSDVTPRRGKANMKFLKNDSNLEISISVAGGWADKQEYNF